MILLLLRNNTDLSTFDYDLDLQRMIRRAENENNTANVTKSCAKT